MEKEFVPYELALRMKQLGFDEECFYVKPLKEKTEFFYTPSDYDDFPEQKELEVGIPLYQQAFRWFRENGFICHITNDLSNNLKDEIYVYVMTKGYGTLIDRSEEYFTYEEAELACLEKLIEIVEGKNKV